MTSLLYLLFFCSGLSGLIYQVVWVRVFGNVFGNTIYSASIVVAVIMLGLGIGSYVVGVWADGRFAGQPESLLRTYAQFELLIGLMGLGISALLPHLGRLSAAVSSYARDAGGWYVLSTTSYLARGGIAILLLAPIAMLMGGTLTLLIRHLVRRDVEIAGWRIALLYGVNTVGAALGCFLTDFALVPAAGLQATQAVAVFFNFVAAAGARLLASNLRATPAAAGVSSVPARSATLRSVAVPRPGSSALALTGLALGLSGCAAMGMEIVWFRHFTLLLGVFRAVYSLLLTVILIGIGVGALLGGFLYRRTHRPAAWLMAVQALFVASTLLGLAAGDVRGLAITALAVERTLGAKSALAQGAVELWFNARPILFEVGVPALLMGFAFPLTNAMIQRSDRSVGRRAGFLYLCNTVGAVCGTLGAGFVLLPMAGLQRSATILAVTGWLAMAPLYAATRKGLRMATAALAGSMLVGGVAVWLWLLLPPDHVITRALMLPAGNQRLVTLSEGVAEVIAVTDDAGDRRWLLTNGHPMSSTGRLDQRYMRALAHIPLLCIDDPRAVLVIGFGVGNTTHAAALHPSVQRVEVADLSREVLARSSYFKDANRDVLKDPRVAVYVNDGRQHLQMQPEASYDLIALEPPPIAHAGVGALYSREFYALARSRLRSEGYISQWLPAYQVPPATTLAMIRAFVEVFPHAVLISGAYPMLQLVGTNASRIEIDPFHVATALSRAPAVQADLQRLDLGSVREIVGTFVGSAQTLAEASRSVTPASDDRPLQEYSVRSLLNPGSQGVPASVADLSRIAEWCPGCFVGGKLVPLAEGLDTYLAVLARVYMVPLEGMTANFADPRTRQMIKSSTYLDTVLDNAAIGRTKLGVDLVSQGRLEEAIDQFEEALRLQPELAVARRNLTTARQVRAGRRSVHPQFVN
jgi:spermidine synthase